MIELALVEGLPMAESLDSEITLSVVSPLFNEEGSVGELVRRISGAVRQLGVRYEIILVDDGSSDETWGRIVSISNADPHVLGLKLSRNFGHQNALLAGFSAARGHAVVSLDGDLQHPPEVIPALFDRWKQGFEVVQAVREDRAVSSRFKKATSALFYRFFSVMTGVFLAEGSSDFRLVDRKVLVVLLSFKDTDIFFRGAVQWVGFRRTTVPFAVEARFSGTTKYSLRKMLKFASGAIVSFSVIPLKFSVYVGLATTMLSIIEILYVVAMYMRGATVPGWASVIGITSLLFGVLFVNLGVIGIYLARLHVAAQGRPRFVVAEVIGKTASQ